MWIISSLALGAVLTPRSKWHVQQFVSRSLLRSGLTWITHRSNPSLLSRALRFTLSAHLLILHSSSSLTSICCFTFTCCRLICTADAVPHDVG